MTGDDAYEFLVAIYGDEDFSDKHDPDDLWRSDVVALIVKLREERDHLRNQLTAASEHVELMRGKRAYLRDGWLREDLSTLDRLLALRLETPQEEFAKRLRKYRSDGEGTPRGAADSH